MVSFNYFARPLCAIVWMSGEMCAVITIDWWTNEILKSKKVEKNKFASFVRCIYVVCRNAKIEWVSACRRTNANRKIVGKKGIEENVKNCDRRKTASRLLCMSVNVCVRARVYFWKANSTECVRILFEAIAAAFVFPLTRSHAKAGSQFRLFSVYRICNNSWSVSPSPLCGHIKTAQSHHQRTAAKTNLHCECEWRAEECCRQSDRKKNK